MITLVFYYKRRNIVKEMFQLQSKIVPKKGEYVYFDTFEEVEQIKKIYKTTRFKVVDNVYMPQKKDEIISFVLIYLSKA